MDITRKLSKQLKRLVTDKKSKLTIYVLGVLWVAVIMQIVVNALLLPKSNLLEAFVSTNSEISSYELEMVADYGSDYLSEADKKELVLYIAKEIGLTVQTAPEVNRNGEECEVLVQKEGKNADTLIKEISIQQKNDVGLTEVNHFIMIKITLYKDMDTILNYRKLLKKVFETIGATNVETTMQLTSNYKGKLSLDNMNSIADNMIANLNGEVAYANRDEDLFNIYAYSGLLDEYVTSMGTKINIHVVMNYDETTDTTNVLLGTPVINGGY